MKQRSIATARLQLRALGALDRAFFCRLYTDPEMMRFVGKPLSPPQAPESFRATLEATKGGEGLRFFVVLAKGGGNALGVCSIQPFSARERSAEIGIMLVREARGQRYACEVIAVLVAIALQTLPIDTVWVQYRKANRGAARVFDALGFSETDGWRPQGARSRLCVRIVQRPLRRRLSNQPQKGVSMSNVIGFLESVGRNAALRHAQREQLLQAMQGEDITPTLQAALLDTSRAQMDSLLGVRETLYCSNFPVKTPPKKAPGKTPVKAPPKKAPAKKPAKKAPTKRGAARSASPVRH